MRIRQIVERMERGLADISPGLALRRAKDLYELKVYNQINQGFDSGTDTHFRPNAMVTTASEDEVTAGTRDKMIANAFQLYRNDPFTRAIVDVTDTYLEPSKPTATTDDKEFNREADGYFLDFWWNMADARRRPGVDFGTLQGLLSNYWWYGGDMLFGIFENSLFPYEGLQIQTPSDLRADKNIVNGIRIQKAAPNRITHFYVADGHHSFLRTSKDFRRIRQNQAFYAPARPWRSAMLRTPPELRAVIDALKDIDRTDRNVQGKIMLDSSICTVEGPGGPSRMPGTRSRGAGSPGDETEFHRVDGHMRIKVTGNPKDFVLSKMENPGGNHVPYMEYAGRKVAAAVGFPYEVAMHLYTKGSFTTLRAGRIDFKKFILKRWAWRNKIFNVPVRNWVIAKAIKSGEIRPAPVDPSTGRSQWHKASWSLPHFPQIDTGKESKANILEWGGLTKSLEDIAQEQGRTRMDLLDAHDKDLAEMVKRAKVLGVSLNEYAGELIQKQQSSGALPGGGDQSQDQTETMTALLEAIDELNCNL